MKFGRTYTLEISLASGEVIYINPPLTVSFSLVHNVLASMNTGIINIFNLGVDNRRKIFHDWIDTDVYEKVTLKAGYEGEKVGIVFQGNIRQAYSYRQGTDWVTTIDAWDGGWEMTNRRFSWTAPANTTYKTALQRIVSGMLGVSVGTISSFGNGRMTLADRGAPLDGPNWELIKDINADGINFINQEKVYCLQDDEYLPNNTSYVISSDTGLLQTPRREQTLVTVQTLFEPNLAIGRMVTLQCKEAIFNGDYRVNGVHHQGIISDAVGGECTTTFDLFSGKVKLQGSTKGNTSLKAVQ